MRVVVANKFWYRRAGLESVMFDEIAGLEALGHEVAHFSTTHPSNVDSPWSAYFAPYLELGIGGGLTLTQKMRAAANLFHNGEAARQFERLLADFTPDLIHIHGIHRQISPSVLRVAARRHIPVIQTLHDYHHVCPCDVLLFRGETPCEPRKCRELWYAAAVTGRCVRGRLSASALSAAETTVSRATRAYERALTRFISPSRFLADVMVAGGWDVPIDVVPNSVASPATSATRCEDSPGEGFAVIGRLRGEKGVEVALRAARQAGVPITVAGDGPLRHQLEAQFPEADFMGHLGVDGVGRLMRKVRAVVVPSLWFENASMTVLESMALGVPVVASRIGGIPEQIADGVDGLLVPPGDVDSLAEKLNVLHEDAGLARRLGDAARLKASDAFSLQRHMSLLLESYGRAVA
jgi:glycosyltransferase involved in cell wall biosynthesis